MTDKDTQEAYPSSWSPRATRILQVAVVVMGIMILIGFAVVVATVISRMSGGGDAAETPAVRVSSPEITSLLGPDAEIVGTETDSGRLAVFVKDGEGIRVLLIDMRSGEVISVIGGS